MNFLIVPDSDIRALQLADRHYSRKTIGSKRMAGPGEHLILVDEAGTFVIGFRKQKYRLDGQQGVECFIFRNESQALSSLILDRALSFVLERWGHTRLFTYIAPNKIKSINPGCCFKFAGWVSAGCNKFSRPCKYKIILEKFI